MFKGTDGANKVELSFELSTEITDITGSYGVYPYTQTYAANSFGKGANVMVYASEDSNDTELFFRNACGYLVIKFYGEGTNVKNVKLTALNGVAKLAGPAAISLTSEGIPEVTMLDGTYPEVTLDCSNGGNGVALGTTKETATEFWFALPPGTIEGGIKITATDTDNNVFVKETKKDISIPRNQIQPMAALEFKNNGTGDYQLIYTRPEGETAPYDFGGSSDYENLKYFDQFITNHYYDSKKLTTLKLDRNLVPDYGIDADEEGFFSEIPSLKNVTLGNNVKTIGNRMFLETGITKITIPGSVDKIDLYAFYNCKSLESITFNASPNNTQLKIVQGFTAGESDLAPFYYSPLKKIDLDRQMHYIDDEGNDFTPDTWDEGIFAYDYWDDDDLNLTTTVKLGDNVTYISKFMFSCVRMTGCWIPKNVTMIDEGAFYYCRQLQSLSLGCTTPPALGEDVFEDCDAFYQINVPYRYQDTYKAHLQWKKVIEAHELNVYYWAGSESL